MKSIALVCLFSLFTCHCSTVSAQTEKFASSGGKPRLVKQVGFRLTQWKTIHGHDAQEAQETYNILRKIGCEVKQANHGNHIDIKFRCPTWKTIETNDGNKSMEWQKWLMNKQFETIVCNPADDTELATVQMRMTEWKTIHSHDAAQAKDLQTTFEAIGCEVQANNHGNHIDIRLRMPHWQTIGLANDQAAHIWMNWLKQSGFETKHEHK